ncbi:MAG: tyrosine-type recombinase/integrase [Dehalococcoidia bacterium]|nr:tyrosine-type recombinase/integrase [Dehalococcoidia bacterium]
MNLNLNGNGDKENLKVSDFLKFMTRQMLLEPLISKSIAEALTEFLLDLKIENKSKRTILFYQERIKPFVDFIGAETKLQEITVQDVKRYFSAQDIEHIYAYHAKYRALRAFLNWCVKQNYLSKTPLRFNAPRLPYRIMPIFSDEDIRAMVKICNVRDKAIIMTLYYTGIRLSELLGMKLGDIEIEARHLTVLGKGKKKRTLQITPKTLKAIWQYLKTRGNPQYDSIWLSEEGMPLTESGLKQIVRRMATRAGITGKKLGPHTFRHTFANNFLDAGGDPLDLKYLLGHASLRMVENYVRAHQEKRALKAQERFSSDDRLGIK